MLISDATKVILKILQARLQQYVNQEIPKVKWGQLYGSFNILWHCPSLGLEWKHFFQSCGHCQVFQICWHTECSTLTALSFRIWNSLTGISPPPLALFVAMLLKAHWTSRSRMSGSKRVITLLSCSIWFFNSSPLSGLLTLCTLLSGESLAHSFFP